MTEHMMLSPRKVKKYGFHSQRQRHPPNTNPNHQTPTPPPSSMIVEPERPVLKGDYQVYAREYLHYVGLYRQYLSVAGFRRVRSKRFKGYTKKFLNNVPEVIPLALESPEPVFIQEDLKIPHPPQKEEQPQSQNPDSVLDEMEISEMLNPVKEHKLPWEREMPIDTRTRRQILEASPNFGLTKNNLFEVLVNAGWTAAKFAKEWKSDSDLRLCHPDYVRLVIDQTKAGDTWGMASDHQHAIKNWVIVRKIILRS